MPILVFSWLGVNSPNMMRGLYDHKRLGQHAGFTSILGGGWVLDYSNTPSQLFARRVIPHGASHPGSAEPSLPAGLVCLSDNVLNRARCWFPDVRGSRIHLFHRSGISPSTTGSIDVSARGPHLCSGAALRTGDGEGTVEAQRAAWHSLSHQRLPHFKQNRPVSMLLQRKDTLWPAYVKGDLTGITCS